MFCTSCGNSLGEADRYCAQCGKANSPGPGAASPRLLPAGDSRINSETYRLVRDMRENKIAGVCAGVARYLGWDVTLVRVGFIILVLLKGVSLLAYLILWIVMPRDDRPPFVPCRHASEGGIARG